jgi:O-antigen/teichoic acid export membrane protein
LWWPFTLGIERIVDHPRSEIAAIVAWIFVSVVLWTIAMGYLSPMVAASNSRAYAVSFGVAAAVNVLANLAAIPLFGLPGAAAVTALSQLAALVTARREVERYHRVTTDAVASPAPS